MNDWTWVQWGLIVFAVVAVVVGIISDWLGGRF